MRKAIHQSKKHARVHEFPDVEPGASTTNLSTFAQLSGNEPESEPKRPRTEDQASSNPADVSPALASVSEHLADKDVLARIPKPQVSAFANRLANLLKMQFQGASAFMSEFIPRFGDFFEAIFSREHPYRIGEPCACGRSPDAV